MKVAKNLPPIFKVENSMKKKTNKEYFYSKDEKKKEDVSLPLGSVVEGTIEEKLDAIFTTRGYSFNIPVSITFGSKTIDTFLATRTKNTIITLDNESIPISLITSLDIKKAIK